MRFWHFYTAAG